MECIRNMYAERGRILMNRKKNSDKAMFILTLDISRIPNPEHKLNYIATLSYSTFLERVFFMAAQVHFSDPL